MHNPDLALGSDHVRRRPGHELDFCLVGIDLSQQYVHFLRGGVNFRGFGGKNLLYFSFPGIS